MKAKKNSIWGANQRKKNRSVTAKANNRLNNLRRKMSRGASNIYRMIREGACWGNKQLWGWKEKGKKSARKKSVTYKSTRVKRPKKG